MFDNIAEAKQTNFLRGLLKNPSVESAAGDHTQRFSEGSISHYLSRGPVFLLDSHISLLIVCADFELGAECLPSNGLRLLGSGLRARLLPLGFHLTL